MPRIVPSQLVAFIERGPLSELLEGANRRAVRPYGVVSGLLALLDKLPNELLPTDPRRFAELVTSVEVLRVDNTSGDLSVEETRAIRTIYSILCRCPDSAAPAGTTEPAFIHEEDLRADLHRDLGDANRALQNGEWKAATVLAGSIVEALLLWALKTRKLAQLAAAEERVGRPIERWDLHQLIECAHAADLITAQTRTVADLGKDFRNLIHPGRAARLANTCNRATALSGVAAVEAVMVDLAR